MDEPTFDQSAAACDTAAIIDTLNTLRFDNGWIEVTGAICRQGNTIVRLLPLLQRLHDAPDTARVCDVLTPADRRLIREVGSP